MRFKGAIEEVQRNHGVSRRRFTNVYNVDETCCKEVRQKRRDIALRMYRGVSRTAKLSFSRLFRSVVWGHRV